MPTDIRATLQETYLQLHADGRIGRLSGGDAFWSMPPAALDAVGRGWLIAQFHFTADWPTWEMHPNGDELVYLLSGAVDLCLERATGIEVIALRDSGAVLVPRGVWHTARVAAPSRMLHVTLGAGTQTRPA